MAVKTDGRGLSFTFPEIHKDAVLDVGFERTLRIPDDGQSYPLPPSLGRFPLIPVDDLDPGCVPSNWAKRGGVALPMWQSEALWISFKAPRDYPFAVKVACGKINALTGERWSPDLDHETQDYLVVPGQPWIDGFCVEPGKVRQFVAMPLGSGFSAEEQITGEAEHGGLQIMAYPIRAEVYDQLEQDSGWESHACFSLASAAPDMGLAPGGTMEQDIYASGHEAADWSRTSSKCFVAIVNSRSWEQLAGDAPPTVPPTAAEYAAFGFPWFAYYDDAARLEGGAALKKLRSVKQMQDQEGGEALPENQGFDPSKVTTLSLTKPTKPHMRAVREGNGNDCSDTGATSLDPQPRTDEG